MRVELHVCYVRCCILGPNVEDVCSNVSDVPTLYNLIPGNGFEFSALAIRLPLPGGVSCSLPPDCMPDPLFELPVLIFMSLRPITSIALPLPLPLLVTALPLRLAFPPNIADVPEISSLASDC